MVDPNITKEIFVSFAGTLLALLSAGLIWFFKSAYEKHGTEILALRKYQIIFANNLTVLTDNFEFIDKWLESINNGRPYSFKFGTLVINEEEIFKLSNLSLINKILSLNYKLRRTELDMENIYRNYWDTILYIDAIQDEQRKEKNLQIYHRTIKQHLTQMKENYEPLKTNSIEVVANIRVAAKVRFHSLFGYLGIFFRDIFPTMNDQAVKVEIEILTKQINERIAERRGI